jgi:hypothetical protein
MCKSVSGVASLACLGLMFAGCETKTAPTPGKAALAKAARAPTAKEAQVTLHVRDMRKLLKLT